MKLLLYTQNHEPGGGNRYFTDFINAVPLIDTVDIACNKGGLFPNDIARIERPYKLTELDVIYKYKKISRRNYLYRLLYIFLNRLPILRTLYTKSLSRKNRKLFQAHLNENKYDVVMAFNGGYPAALSCFDLLRVASVSSCKTYMSVVSMPAPKSYIDKIYSPTLRYINGFIVNCNAIKEALSGRDNISPSNIQTLYNCVTIPTTSNNYTNSNAHIRFGFVGRVEYLKGAQLLVEAFAEALKSNPNISLTLYGKNMLGKQLIDRVKSNQEKIIFNGPFNSSEIDVYPNIDVLILPSFWEGFPYVIIEAMSHKIPVIASNVGGISEIVHTGENGILIEARNKEQLIQAILNISNSNANLAQKGENALSEVKTRFARDVFNEQVKTYIEKINYIRR